MLLLIKKICLKKFKKIPKMPKIGIHPCSGCQDTFYKNFIELTCPIQEETYRRR